MKQFSWPVVIFIVILVMGWFGRQYVVEQDLEKRSVETAIMAEQVGIRLHDFIKTRLTRLEIFRESMEQKVFTEAEFRAKALLIQHELTGFQAINWIDNDGTIQWVTPLSRNRPALGANLKVRGSKGATEAFGQAALYRTDVATTSIELLQGGLGFASYYPIIRGDNIAGFVNGVFRVEDLITQCFGNSIGNFHYRAMLAGKAVFTSGSIDSFHSAEIIDHYIFVLLGQTWELQVIPAQTQTDTVKFMDMLALLVTFVIAALLSMITLNRQQSRLDLAEAYKTIEDSELKFRTIFDRSPACLLRFNQGGVVTDWNRTAAAVFSLEFPPSGVKHITDLEGISPLLPSVEKALSGENADFSGFIEVKNQKMAVDSRIETLLSGTDQIQGGIILLNNVTERNQTLMAREVMYEIANHTNSTKQLPQLFESIHKSLSRVLDTRNFYVALYDDKTGEFSYPYYKDEFDSAPPTPIKNEKGLSAYMLSKQGTQLFSKEEIYALNREGKIELIGTPSEQWLGVHLKVEGKPIGVMAVQTYSTDIIFGQADMDMFSFVSDQIAVAIKINLEDAKLRKSEMMHRELSSKLNDSNNTKALLIDIITHDLKNPASVIAGVADLLSTEGEQKEEFKLIQDSSDALLKVIKNTTSLARVTLGEEIEMEGLNLSQLAEEVVQEFKPGFDKRNKPLETEIEHGIIVQANQVIAEIFRNYLSNALRYAPSGRKVVCGLNENESRIKFYVHDLGESISRDDQKTIFQRRVQLTNRSRHGSGLGLAIVRRIADVHGAKVGVESSETSGNIFYLELPKTIEPISE